MTCIHHSFADGRNLWATWLALDEDNKYGKPLPDPYATLEMKFKVPMASLQQIAQALMLKNEQNCFKLTNKPSGKLFVKHSQVFYLPNILKKCKEIKITFNNAMLAVMGVAMRKYALNRGHDDLKKI